MADTKPGPRGGPPTVDALRHAIDSGRTGDKVAHPDPAAAPLGTDAEAGGIPPSLAARLMAARQGLDQGRGGAGPHPSEAGVVVWYVLALCAFGLIVGAILVLTPVG